MKKVAVDKHLYLLKGFTQHYDWGGDSFIPSVTLESSNGLPMAEYWLGAHSSAPSVILPDNVPLNELLASHPSKYLQQSAETFSTLPFLLKLLDVKKMLSIQVHPSKETARRKYAEENAKGIALNSSSRNYKDENHKPELMVAMSEFWLLHGFKPETQLLQVLKTIPEFAVFIDTFDQNNYKKLYTEIMQMPQDRVNTILHPLLSRIIPLYHSERLKKESEDFWAARAALTFNKGEDIDRGIFSIYLFNLVRLEKGQAVFQDAGVPHAYLEGWNVEIMANSDNVLRGGLTPKHIDVNELLENVKCEATHPVIINGEKRGEEIVFVTPVNDFELSYIETKQETSLSLNPASPTIFLLIKGKCVINSGDTRISLAAGSPSAIAFPGSGVMIETELDALIFKASVPIHRQ